MGPPSVPPISPRYGDHVDTRMGYSPASGIPGPGISQATRLDIIRQASGRELFDAGNAAYISIYSKWETVKYVFIV